MKLLVKIMIPALLLIVIADIVTPAPDLAYSNENGTFTFEEMNFKARNFDMCKRIFAEYKKTEGADTILYRIRPKSFWRFWEYSDYVFKEQFQLPYINWDEVKQRRGTINAKTGWMDF